MGLRYIIIILLFIFQSFSFASSYHLQIEKYKLSNGLTVITEEDQSTSLVNMQLWVRAGSCYEGKFLGSGITHLVEHMVFKGEKSQSSMRIAKELRRLGGELDASTSKEYTHFNITIDKENLGKAMEHFYAIITKAEFMPEELDKEKEVVMREMDTVNDDPQRFLTEGFFRLSFQGHPYGEPVIGKKDLFEKITREGIIEFYKEQYVPRNMILILAGNFEFKELKKTIDNLWGQIPDVIPPRDYIPHKPSVKGPNKELFEKDVSGVYLMAGFYGPSIDSKDLYPMDVLAEIAGGGKKSRLVKKIKDKLGLVTDIDAWSFTPAFSGIWGVSADLTGEDWGLVLKNIMKEVYEFRFNLVGSEELSRAKKRIIRRYLKSLETIEGRAGDLGSNEIYTRNPLFVSTYINGIRNVMAEDIRQASLKYFGAENFSIAILVPKIPEKAVKPVLKEKEIVCLKLDNGIRVLVKEDHRMPLVTIRLGALGGLLEEEIPGLSYFTSQLWLRERDDLVKKIESLGGSISSYSGNNSFGCAIEAYRDDIESALEVIGMLLSDITVTPEKMEVSRRIQLTKIRQEEDTPYGFAFKNAKSIFFGGHPYRNSIMGNCESVAKIAAEDIKNFFNKSLAPDNIVISIIGDVDIKNIEVLTSAALATGSRPFYTHAAVTMPAVMPSINEKILHRVTDEAVILLAYPGVSVYSEDRYAIEILTQIFSGQAGRIYESIREEEALSYSVGALNIIGREPGSFIFYISTTAENIKSAKEILFKEVKRIKEEGASEEELESVKKYFTTQIQKEWESTSGLGLEVTLDELYGLGWDYYKKYIENIKKVSVDDIKNASNKYFRDDWHTLVLVGKISEEK